MAIYHGSIVTKFLHFVCFLFCHLNLLFFLLFLLSHHFTWFLLVALSLSLSLPGTSLTSCTKSPSRRPSDLASLCRWVDSRLGGCMSCMFLFVVVVVLIFLFLQLSPHDSLMLSQPVSSPLPLRYKLLPFKPGSTHFDIWVVNLDRYKLVTVRKVEELIELIDFGKRLAYKMYQSFWWKIVNKSKFYTLDSFTLTMKVDQYCFVLPLA